MRQLLFADQLGPHFDLGGEITLVESLGRLKAHNYHWAKAQLILSAIRHRAAESNRVTLIQSDGYREFLASLPEQNFVAINPTSYGFRKLVESDQIKTLPSRGFVTDEIEFQNWVVGKAGKRLLLEDFYRWSRQKHSILMDGAEPAGGQWNFDHEKREPAPKKQAKLGVAEPWWPVEDEIDAQVRADLRSWQQAGLINLTGTEGPRLFAATREEALAALDHFIDHRLPSFGPWEDAALADDWAMSHSLLSVPLNLGLLDPLEVVQAAEAAFRAGKAPINSVEGFIRQIMGWRDYVWHLYWHFGESYVDNNALNANVDVPKSWLDLDPESITSNCIRHTIGGLGERGWLHHIERLMILGNVAMQRSFNPAQLNQWFIDNFVDGTPWVMPANVIGMSQFADGGMMRTKPYAGGGSYISKMTNYCGGCQFDPKQRVGEQACPVTAGYWNFLSTHEAQFRQNRRMLQPLAGLKKLADLEQILVQEANRGTEL